jgi:hypothetical protein
MKHFYLFSVLFLFSSGLYAQQVRDVVQLHNGNILKGHIMEQNNESVKIETCCGNIYVLKQSEVDSILSESVPYIRNRFKTKGYINFTSMGFLLGSPSNDKIAPFSLVTEHNYRVDEYFAVGALIGYEMLDEAIMPLGLNMKVFLLNQSGSIFMGLTGGYSFSLENPNKDLYNSASGGGFFATELGVVIPVSENNSFFVCLGYRYNKLKYERTDWWLGEVDREVQYNRISIRLGISIY